MNDMGRLGVVWQILLGIVLAIGGIILLGNTIGWAGAAGVFLLAFGLIVINGTKFPKKSQGKKKR